MSEWKRQLDEKMGKTQATVYTITGEQMVELVNMARQWCQRHGIKNIAVGAQCLRHVADTMERTAKAAGYGASPAVEVTPKRGEN